MGSIQTNTDDDDEMIRIEKESVIGKELKKVAEKEIPLYESVVKPLAKAGKKWVDKAFKKDEDPAERTQKFNISYTEVPEGGSNNKDNTFSMLFFNSSLIVVGAILIIFYRYFNQLFIFKKDSKKSIFLSKICGYIGIVAGVMFAGVGIFPHDFHFGAHVFFANGAFTVLLILSIVHTLSFIFSNHIQTKYAIGYIIFCILLSIYLYIIFYGPEIGPGRNFSASDLILQVVAQKMIVLSFIISMLYQVSGIKRAIK